MVKERRYVFDVSDIDSLIYACANCGQEIVCKLDGQYAPGATCVSCQSQLLMTRTANGTVDPRYTLLMNLRNVLRVQDPATRIRFVVPDPDQA